MRKRMFLQLFEDGGGAGSGGQGGNAGAGNGRPGKGGGAGTALRRQKRLPMREQTELKKRRFVPIFSSRE